MTWRRELGYPNYIPLAYKLLFRTDYEHERRDGSSRRSPETCRAAGNTMARTAEGSCSVSMNCTGGI